MLVVIAVVALLGGGALHDAWFAQSLADSRLYRQRAFSLAELGLRFGVAELAAAAPTTSSTRNLQPTPVAGDALQVRIQRVGTDRVPPGFSAGRFIARDYEIHSTGRSLRGANSQLVQGITRIEASAAASHEPGAAP
jgi:hypothetical protein